MTTFSPRAVTSSQPPRILAIIRATITISLLMFAALFLFGCATTPTDRAAKLLASTVQTVDVAMQGYGMAVALDLVPADDQVKLLKIYADYQAAVALAETAITTAINSGDAGSLVAATKALDASKFQLLAFLARFTTSPPTP